MTVREEEVADAPSRSEVGEYVHDLAEQLAVLAAAVGLDRTAAALKQVSATVEAEF